MTQNEREVLLDLLIEKALYGLDIEKQRSLDAFDPEVVTSELESFEASAAAVNMAGLERQHSLPDHLRSRILQQAAQHVRLQSVATGSDREASAGGRWAAGWFNWLGWAAAAAAVIALAVNVWLTRIQPVPEQARTAETPRTLSVGEQREELLRADPAIVRASFTSGNVKEMKDVAGDVVWSDARQAGFLRLRGLAVRTAPDHCYQLWIFDKTQDKSTPVDGGTFDVTADGEIIVPINAKLAVDGPYMFAITIERHGGVVVSKREQIAALAKVEKQAS